MVPSCGVRPPNHSEVAEPLFDRSVEWYVPLVWPSILIVTLTALYLWPIYFLTTSFLLGFLVILLMGWERDKTITKEEAIDGHYTGPPTG